MARDSLGHFVKGSKHGATVLPQTPEGWIDRLIEVRFGTDSVGERTVIYRVGIRPIRLPQIARKHRQKVQNDPVKHAEVLVQKRNSHWRNQDADNLRSKNQYHHNKEEYNLKAQQYYEDHREEILLDQQDWYWHRGGREIARIYARNNPKASGGSDSIVAAIAMNSARKRDNHMCQWGGNRFGVARQILSEHGIKQNFKPCNKKADQVAHLLGRKTHPEFEAEMWNLLSLCFDHHIEWHSLLNEPGPVALIKYSRKEKYGF